MKSYQSLSALVYQIDKPIGRSFGDVEYYQARLAGVTGKILEPAVGTGRILIPLLAANYDISGFDLSESMLHYCQLNLTAQQFDSKGVWKDDLTKFQVQEPVEAIIIPTGTFQLLDSEEKAIQSLKQCFKALKSGGRLLIDTSLAHQFILGKCESREFTTTEGDLITLQMINADIDHIEQVTTSHHRYDQWHQGAIVASEWEVFRLKWFGVSEFKHLLEMVGFVNISISADYTYLRAPNNNSEIMTYEAYKS
nr:class I SAM-dependent methyltransferase [uncultured Moellerella sp.]